MASEDSISVIIPAFNEEKNIEPTVMTVLQAVKRSFCEYEIIIFNDGSTDKTAEVVEKLSAHNENIRFVHHKRPHCLGGVYKEGRKMARMNYLMLVNGKDDTSVESLERIFCLKGKSDIIIPYTINSKDRSITRRLFSNTFVFLLNRIFKLNLKYYNHYVLHKRTIINSIDIQTNSYAFQAEALLKLIKAGHNYTEVGVMDKFRKNVKTKAFNIRNVLGVGLFLIKTIFEINFKKNNKKECA